MFAGDVARFEHEERVPSVVIAQSERYMVEVGFPHAGRYTLVNAVQAINHYEGEFRMGVVEVGHMAGARNRSRQFATLRDNPAATQDIDKFRPYFDKEPDKTFPPAVRPGNLPLFTVQFISVAAAYFAPVEWVDGMPIMNWLSSSKQLEGASATKRRGRRTGTSSGT